MGVLSTAIAFGAGYVVGANRDTVRRVTTKAREVASRTTARGTGGRVTDIRLVSEVMTGVTETVRPDMTVAEAAKRMRDGDIGDVLVTETEGDAVMGIVTDRDIAIRAVAAGHDPGATTLRSIMSRDIASVSPSDTIEDAKAQMRAANVRRLPVIENRRPVGIVSLGDLSLSSDTGGTLADISVAPPDRQPSRGRDAVTRGVVSLVGGFDLAEADAFFEWIGTDKSQGDFVLDRSALTFLDSSGIYPS